MPQYDYIIAGAGCAGLSLLVRMVQTPFFSNKQILVIDQAPKTTNDRTWCFWETKPGLFEPVVHHRWQQLHFYAEGFSSHINIAPYVYKMIRGIDFYNFVLQQAKQCPNIHFYCGKIQETGNEGNLAFAKIDGEKYYARYLFNSILYALQNAGCISLLQHFKGWLIETPENLFDNTIATFMDFRVGQQQGATFVYVLPVTPNKALVEFTLISKSLLAKGAYEAGLRDYIYNYVTQGSYSIAEEEFGVIPMTDYKFPKGDGNIINIGAAGGQTKASSGFTFQFIQKHSAAIVEALAQNKCPLVKTSVFQSRFHFYDSILLNIISTGRMPGDQIFARLFKKIPPQTILRFLDNESSLFEELKIMASMPAGVFLPTAIEVSTKS